jgi:hypothetical protein
MPILGKRFVRYAIAFVSAPQTGPSTEERGAEVDAAYVLSLKQEVDSLFAQQRVGIAWTRFLRCVERRSRDTEGVLSRARCAAPGDATWRS